MVGTRDVTLFWAIGLLFASGCSESLKSRDGRPKSIAAHVEEPPPLVRKNAPTNYRQSFAIVVGIDRYTRSGDEFPALKNAANDARAVWAILRDEFGYTDDEVVDDDDDNMLVLLNERATKSAICDGISKWLPARGAREDDAVLFFFSGHGVVADSEGYVAPVDIRSQNVRETGLSVTWLRGAVKAVRCRHKAMILDCCSSGTLFSFDKLDAFGVPRKKREGSSEGVVGGDGLVPTTGPATLRNLDSGSNRFVAQNLAGDAFVGLCATRLSAAADDTGRDGHSLFTSELLRALTERADSERWEDHVFTFQRMALQVSERVDDAPGGYQTPVCGFLARSSADFIFRPTRRRRTPTEGRDLEAYAKLIEKAQASVASGDYSSCKRCLQEIDSRKELRRFKSFEWSYLARTVDPCPVVRLEVAAVAAAVSERGKYIAVSEMRTKTLSVWAAGTGNRLRVIGKTAGSVSFLRWAGDTRLLVVSEDGEADVWDCDTSTRVFADKLMADKPRDAAWSTDGSRFGVASEGGCAVVEPASGKTWKIETGGVGLAFTLTASDVVVAEEGGKLIKYRLTDWPPAVGRVKAFDMETRIVRINRLRDPNRLAVVSSRECFAVEMEGGRVVGRRIDLPVRPTLWHGDYGFALAAGRFVYTAPLETPSVCVRSLDDDRVDITLRTAAPARQVSIDTTGNLVSAVCVDGSVHVWDNMSETDAGGSPLKVAAMPIFYSLSWDGSVVALADMDIRESVLVVEPHTGRVLKRFDLGREVSGLWSISASRKFVAVSAMQYSKGGMVLALDLEAENGERRVISCASDTFLAVQFSPDGRHLVLGNGKKLEVWECPSWRKEREIECSSRLMAGTHSWDGSVFATGYEDGRIKLWRTGDWLELAEMRGGGAITAIAFDHSGTHLATTDVTPDVLRLFDGLRGRSPVLEQVATVFSGADRSGLTLWEISSRKKLWTVWPAGMSYVAGCAFSSDDARIATSGACFFTPKALLLDRVSGRVVASLDYRVDGRTAFGVGGGASFDPDGRFLMTGGMLLDVSGPLNKGMGPMVWRAEGVGTRKEN